MGGGANSTNLSIDPTPMISKMCYEKEHKFISLALPDLSQDGSSSSHLPLIWHWRLFTPSRSYPVLQEYMALAGYRCSSSSESISTLPFDGFSNSGHSLAEVEEKVSTIYQTTCERPFSETLPNTPA